MVYKTSDRRKPAITPVTKKAHPNQIKNEAGGYVFAAGDWQRFERKSPNAKLIMVATQANGFSVGNPDDPNYLQIAGFSADVPQLINSFISM